MNLVVRSSLLLQFNICAKHIGVLQVGTRTTDLLPLPRSWSHCNLFFYGIIAQYRRRSAACWLKHENGSALPTP